MSTKAIDPSAPNTLVIEPTHARQTQPPATPFRDILATSVSVLTTGAEVATGIMGGPIAAAAVHQAGVGLTRQIAGPANATGYASTATGIPGASTGPATATALNDPTTSGAGSDMVQMQAMQKESQMFNLQLLQLQENVQNENRHFTTVSNVLRASHDTAKAAISNVRS